MNNVLGRFCWHDLITTDLDAALPFYREVVGWTVEHWDGAGHPYPIWHTPSGRGVGGAGPLPDDARAMGAPPHWMAHIATPHLADTVGQAERLGATVLVPPTPIPTVGAFAILADPHGTTFAAFQAEGDVPGHDGAPEIGDFAWHELMAPDLDAAFDFYAALFGWQRMGAMDMGPMGSYVLYGRGERMLGGMMRTPPEMPVAGAWLHYAHVADVPAAVATAQRLGGTLLHGPQEVPGGDLIAHLLDPQGGMFALHGSKP